MNWRHLQAFLWLRWRLSVNQWKRGGALNGMLMAILATAGLVMAVPVFFICFLLGLFAFDQATPVNLLYAWDGLVIVFVFFWTVGLMSELQRTESLSLSKFLHLPVSINSAFLINYISSLLCLSLVAFVPMMLGFGLSLVFAQGFRLILVLPLVAAFLLMVTALTYQFQGWLASLMSNPRRRRTVVVTATAVFILIFQLPNMLNVIAPWGARQHVKPLNGMAEDFATLERDFQSQRFDAAEHLRRQQDVMKKHEFANRRVRREKERNLEQAARLANLALPVGWLPWGVMASASSHILQAICAGLAMAFIGSASLWRAYRTTIRLYRGQFTSGRIGRARAVSSTPQAASRSSQLLEKQIPWVSESASAVALAGWRSLLRAPEAKMMILTPLLLGVVFGSTVLRWPSDMPVSARPLLAIGAIALTLFGMAQLMANQFGFDRDGFRVFVLCAARRRDILLGKNLSFAPLALGIALLMLCALQFLLPLRGDHLLAMLPQFISMYLAFCLMFNLLSIYAPMPIAAGSLKPVNPKLTTLLLQMIVISSLFPLIQLPTLLPLGIETASEWMGWTAGTPICLVLTLAECAAMVVIYRFVLDWEGHLFHAREQRILEIVTNRAP